MRDAPRPGEIARQPAAADAYLCDASQRTVGEAFTFVNPGLANRALSILMMPDARFEPATSCLVRPRLEGDGGGREALPSIAGVHELSGRYGVHS